MTLCQRCLYWCGQSLQCRLPMKRFSKTQSLWESKKGNVPVVPFPACLSFISHEHYRPQTHLRCKNFDCWPRFNINMCASHSVLLPQTGCLTSNGDVNNTTLFFLGFFVSIKVCYFPNVNNTLSATGRNALIFYLRTPFWSAARILAS